MSTMPMPESRSPVAPVPDRIVSASVPMSRAEAFTCMLPGAREATVSFRSTCARPILFAGLGLAALASSAAAQGTVFDVPQAEVLLLGTFHFDDPGLDSYRPQFPWDPFTADHQREIEDVVRLLARFRPTRIALESPASRQPQLDAAYTAFLEDRATLGPAEGQQLGFRLARELGHERVYAVDAPARSYFPGMTQEEYERRVTELVEDADAVVMERQEHLTARYDRFYREADSLKVVLPLRDFLVWANEPERVLLSHGAYLIGGFYLGRDGDYFGPDMRTRWYNRNLRIFHNLQRLTRSPAERILVIIGSGHLPILRHAVKASPEYRLVEAGDYLRR